ncbi:MAG: PEP-CTERM sorting domain-containing protein [Phycisphaerae bacterium]|nr:PEP-CTERM sorting domain-containing protein [Phycisphaerae bacterium]
MPPFARPAARLFPAIIGTATCIAASPALAGPQMFISDSTNTLWRLALDTGQADRVGETAGLFSDITFTPDGRLYGVTFDYLYEIDPETGWSTLIGRHGFSNRPTNYGIDALAAFGDGTLYAAGNDVLITIDPLTGQGTRVGSLGGHRSAGDLTFDDTGRLLMPTDLGLLVSVHLDGSGADVIGSIPYRDIFAIGTIDDGTVYGIRSNNQIVTIDPDTGAAQPGPFIHADQLIGRAWGGSVPNVHFPEPATAALLLLGAAVLVFARQHRTAA